MAWDESKHPRDGDGRFSENQHERDEKKRDAVRHIYDSDGGRVRIPLDFFAEKKDYSNEPIPDVPKEVFGFADKERKNTANHIKHAKEMGYKNQDEYERAALDFWKNSKGEVYYSHGRKRFYKYDGARFVSFDTEGTLRTFMKMTQKDFERKKVMEKL
jgi:hypothetical protein